MPTSVSKGTENGKLHFEEVRDPKVLIPVLKERYPVSCMMYNQVMIHHHFIDDLKFYTVGVEINSNTWILSKNIRQDYGYFGMSAPVGVSAGTEKASKEVKECFSSGNVIDWNNLDDVVITVPVPKGVSDMIVDIAANEKGNVTEVHPVNLYYMDREDAFDLDIRHDDPNVQIRRLDESKHESEFIYKNWAYSRPGSEEALSKCVAKNASGGVFVNGDCVCGVCIPAIGILTALYTLREHRKKGYAKQVMNYTFKEFAKDGCIPCLAVELKNPGSIKFHEGLGLKVATRASFILIKKLVID